MMLGQISPEIVSKSPWTSAKWVQSGQGPSQLGILDTGFFFRQKVYRIAVSTVRCALGPSLHASDLQMQRHSTEKKYM